MLPCAQINFALEIWSGISQAINVVEKKSSINSKNKITVN